MGRVVDIFAWTLNIFDGYTDNTSKNGSFCEELPSENDFEAVLATSCCYDYDTNTSEAVQKIATDQNEYHKCPSGFMICWIAKIYQSINNSENDWLLGHLRRS